MNQSVSPLQEGNWKSKKDSVSPAVQQESGDQESDVEKERELVSEVVSGDVPQEENAKPVKSGSSTEGLDDIGNEQKKKYKYRAIDRDGKQVDGELSAASKDEVAGFLHGRGMTVLEVRENIGFNIKELGSIQIGGVPLGEKVIFMKQFATMTSAGLPLVTALSTLVSQIKNAYFRTQLDKVLSDVENGMKLSLAFKRRAKMFSEIELNLISAGEESGNLVEMLRKIADNAEKTKEFRGKVRGALIYPAVIVSAVVGVAVLLMLFMIPAVSDLFEDFDTELPIYTRIMIWLSDFMVNYWWAILIFIISTSIGFFWYRTTPSGRLVTDKVFLRIPVFGQLLQKIQTAELSRLLAMLMQSGIPILTSLDITASALSNIHFSNALRTASSQVEKGIPLAVPFSKSEVIPVLMVKMVATGEETGNLDKVLGDVAHFYQTEADEMTDNLTKLLEPFILILVAGMVGVLALAIYGPIFQLAQVIA